MPSKSPFAAPLERMLRLMPLMEEQVAESEEVLADLLDKLSDMVRQTIIFKHKARLNPCRTAPTFWGRITLE